MKLLTLLLLPLTGCATAHLIGDRPPLMRVEAGPPRTVVIEPLFERAEWRTTTRQETATAPIGAGSPIGTTTTTTRTVTEKPLFAKAQTLAIVHEKLLPMLASLRPHWTIVAPGAVPTLTRPATVVRTVIDGNELVESDRTLKNAAFAFGLVVLPLQIITAFPVEETQRVAGQLERVSAEPKALQGRLVKYATQPDYAVNLSGLPAPKAQPFSFDLQYEEGLFADESPRPGVLIDGFVERLAWAIITFVEEESP